MDKVKNIRLRLTHNQIHQIISSAISKIVKKFLAVLPLSKSCCKCIPDFPLTSQWRRFRFPTKCEISENADVSNCPVPPARDRVLTIPNFSDTIKNTFAFLVLLPRGFTRQSFFPLLLPASNKMHKTFNKS